MSRIFVNALIKAHLNIHIILQQHFTTTFYNNIVKQSRDYSFYFYTFSVLQTQVEGTFAFKEYTKKYDFQRVYII